VTHAHSHHSHAHTHMMGNPLCRNFLLQHCYSIVYYSSYMHATGLANMNKGKCFVLAVAFIVWNIYSTIQGNYVSKNFNTHIVDPELSDISLVSYAWVFNRNINKMFVCTCLYAFVTYAIGASASGRSYIHQS
jgi:hypothetical protein